MSKVPDGSRFGSPLPTDERDIALGQFMQEWAELETQLLLLFYTLIGTPIQIAEAIFLTGFQSMNLVELFIALGQIRLPQPEQQKLKRLCKRYREAAAKRNKIVHGSWYPTDESCEWARIYIPINQNTRKQIYDKSNQKIRSKYRFTIKELQTATEHISKLSFDFLVFTDVCMNLLYHDELP